VSRSGGEPEKADKGEPGPEPDIIDLERALVGRAQAGDREALRLLLGRHSDALYCRVILPRAGDTAVAEDVLKETMVTAIEKLGTFRWQGRSIYFWLRQIAVNKVIDHHRATGRSGKLAQAIASEPEPTILPTRETLPEAALIAEEERRINAERIGATLEQINPRYRKAIELRLIEELPREECARRLEVTVGTFDVLLFRAVRAFRRAFGERDAEE
jgi:RNA polymerase sigma-70 factor (ECF subfamily)